MSTQTIAVRPFVFARVPRFPAILAGMIMAGLGIASAQQPSKRPSDITLPDLDTSKLKLDPHVSSRSPGYRDCIFMGPDGQSAMVHMEDHVFGGSKSGLIEVRSMKIKKGDWMFESVSKDANGKEIRHGMGRNGMGTTRDAPPDPLHPVEVRLTQRGPSPPTSFSLLFPFVLGVEGLNSQPLVLAPEILAGFHTYSKLATPAEIKQGQAAGKKIYERCREYFSGLGIRLSPAP